MNHKGILFFLGFFSLLVSVFSILNILYSIYLDFVIDLSSYFYSLVISFIAGSSFVYIGYNHSKNITLIDQIIFIIISFFYIPLLISIPYIFSSYDIGLLNSFFESVSGFTATGFSIIDNVKSIDEPLILWRSSSQWLGGLFFLLITIGTIGSKQIKIKPAYLISGGATGKNFYYNFNYNFIKILLIYFFSTILIILLYSLTNIRFFDAFNLAFTAISSGGFIPTNNLSNIISSDLNILVISISLLFPIFNFFILFDIITKKFTFRDHQEDLHLFALIIFLTSLLYFFIVPNEGFFQILFAITSSLSTSGISTYSSDFDLSLFLLLLTASGGSLISTSSGFKYTRFYILLKISYQEIYRLAKPINVIDKNLYNSEKKIDDQDVKISFMVFILFIISIFVLSAILTLDSITFEDSFKLSILTLTNTVTSALYGLDNLIFLDLNSLTKITLIIFMIVGKIELIAFLYLIKRFIFKE